MPETPTHPETCDCDGTGTLEGQPCPFGAWDGDEPPEDLEPFPPGNHELRLAKIEDALECLRSARTLLASAPAPRAAEAVRRAINSAEGARRHAAGLPYRQMARELREAQS